MRHFNCKTKTLEPCCGKGNFVLAIFEAYFEKLSNIEDEVERCVVIIEECIYFCDIDPVNVYITEELLKCHALSKMKKDHHSRRGLLNLVSKRKKLLNYRC